MTELIPTRKITPPGARVDTIERDLTPRTDPRVLVANSAPGNVLLCIPALDGRMDCLTAAGIMQVLDAYGTARVRPYWNVGDSNIRHCRNSLAHQFKMRATDCEWSVWIDTDIEFSLQDFAYLMEADHDIVIGLYARKAAGALPVDFGMGFTRIHRRVFLALDDWLIEDGPEAGTEALMRYYLNGEIATDYFFDGATSDSRWLSEDTGFFHYCAMKGITMRHEKRCRLKHWGRFGFGYPDQLPGFVPVESGAQ